jgi:hypothetical protein
MTKTCSNSALTYRMQCYILPAQGCWCDKKYFEYYELAYKLWHDVKLHALQHESNLKNIQELDSDDFLRQHEIIALFLDKEPVGMIGVNWMDLSSAAYLDHTYFSCNYSNQALNKLRESMHQQVMVVEQCMVARDWRKRKIGIGISEILLGLSMLRFLDSAATALISCPRNNRGMHKSFYRLGALSLEKNHLLYGSPSDIILITRENARLSTDQQVANLTKWLWSKKTKIARSDAQFDLNYPEKNTMIERNKIN